MFISEADEHMRGYSLEVPKIVEFRSNKKIDEIAALKNVCMSGIRFKACDLFYHFHFKLDGEGVRNPNRWILLPHLLHCIISSSKESFFIFVSKMT